VPNGLAVTPALELSENEKAELKRTFLGMKADRPLVLMACRLARYKGVVEFLEAARESATKDAVFAVAGDGEMMPVLSRLAAQDALAGRFRLLGHVEDLGPLYAASDVLVSCSHAEGMSYSLLEAMRARKAIVATDVPGNRELIEHAVTGLLVPCQASRIAQAVDSLLGDSARRALLGSNAYKRFKDRHTIDLQASGLLALYRAAAGMGDGAARLEAES